MSAYLFFTPESATTFRAAAGCIVPSEPNSPGADCDEAIRLADRAISERPEADRRLLALFLRVLERLPVVRYGRPFSKLPPDKQAAVLVFLEKNRLLKKFRQGFFGIKTFALLGYYGRDDTWTEIDYPGPKLDAPYYQLRAKGPAP